MSGQEDREKSDNLQNTSDVAVETPDALAGVHVNMDVPGFLASANVTPTAEEDKDQEEMFSLLFNSFSSEGVFSRYRSDEDEGKPAIEQMTHRDEKYTKLLESYVNITQTRNVVKEIHKWLFFWIIVATCCAFGTLAYKTIAGIMNSGDTDYIISAIPVVIAAFVSLITAVIGIPLAITQFLFNTKEDEYIVELIKHTQEHDSAGRILLKDRFIPRKDSDKKLAMQKTDDR